VKRVLTLLGLPVLLGLVWWSGSAKGPGATAEVAIDTTEVTQVRGDVIDRLTALGATKVGEDTAYGDESQSKLRFRIPTVRLEEALAGLDGIGGTVTAQRVQLADVDAAADGVADELAGVGTCLEALSDDVGRSSADATRRLEQCRERLTATDQRLTEVPDVAGDAVLSVDISRTSTTSAPLIVAVVLLGVVLATMAYLTLRSTRGPIVDVTEPRRDRLATDELYERRN